MLLASAGFMSLVKYKLPFKELFSNMPVLKEGLECSLCLGFWAGVGITAAFYSNTGVLLWHIPFMTSGFCWLFDSIVDLIHVTAEKNDLQCRGTAKDENI